MAPWPGSPQSNGLAWPGREIREGVLKACRAGAVGWLPGESQDPEAENQGSRKHLDCHDALCLFIVH